MNQEEIGLPYAAAGFDDHGYHVICPACGEKFHAVNTRTEDEATKDPTALYGVHYLMKHGSAGA
jgi:hypothetical protein